MKKNIFTLLLVGFMVMGCSMERVNPILGKVMQTNNLNQQFVKTRALWRATDKNTASYKLSASDATIVRQSFTEVDKAFDVSELLFSKGKAFNKIEYATKAPLMYEGAKKAVIMLRGVYARNKSKIPESDRVKYIVLYSKMLELDETKRSLSNAKVKTAEQWLMILSSLVDTYSVIKR